MKRWLDWGYMDGAIEYSTPDDDETDGWLSPDAIMVDIPEELVARLRAMEIERRAVQSALHQLWRGATKRQPDAT